MNKKVCHITSAHDRYDVRIFVKECISLANNGYDVALIVNDTNPDEIKECVKIVSTKFKPRNRIERFLNSKKLLLAKAIEVDADIYHLHDPDLLPLGNKLKSNGKKVIFDSHEDIPKQVMDKTWIPKIFRGAVSKIYSIYEKNTLRKYDAVISVTPHIVERLLKTNSNTVMVTNYPNVDFKNNVNREPNNSICFAGGIGSQYNHEKIIKAIENIEDIRYILMGNGTKEYLSLLQSLPAWERVDYLGVVPHKEVKEIYVNSIAGLALDYSSQGEGQGTLGVLKIFEYMEASIPVICSNYKLWKEIVEGNECGICVDPKNIDEITESIKYLLDNPKEAKKMGNNGRRAVIEKYNWGTQEKVLLDLYESL